MCTTWLLCLPVARVSSTPSLRGRSCQANALNGQVRLGDLSDFTHDARTDYASRLAAIGVDVDLADMGQEEMDNVVAACAFGYPGVWGPKITKVGAL